VSSGQSTDVIENPGRPSGVPCRFWRGFGRVGGLAQGLVVPAALLIAWGLSANLGWLPEQILPPPSEVFGALRETMNDGTLLSSTLTSLRRVAEGFFAGAVLGLGFGFVTGASRLLETLFAPLFLTLSQVPTLGWIPILILIVGIDESLKVLIIGWAAFIPVALNTAQGVRDVPRAYLELGRVLSFNRWSTLRSIILPSAVPSIFTGLREGLANSWQTLVVVELIASFEGLGYLMAYGRQLFQLELVLAAMIVVGLIGRSINLVLSLIESHLQRWNPGRQS
jgi:sulfonate transport system permease protein